MTRNTSSTICGASPIDGSSMQQHGRLGDQRPGDRQHLLLAAGQRSGRQVRAAAASTGNRSYISSMDSARADRRCQAPELQVLVRW